MKEKGWCIKVYGENALFRHMHYNYYNCKSLRERILRAEDAKTYNYTLFRRESYCKFMFEEIHKYKNMERRIKDEDDLY